VGRTVIAAVVGHRMSAQGAVNTRGVSEYIWNGTLAADVVAALAVYGVEAQVYERPNHRGGYQEVCDLLNRDKVEAVVSLHFNAATPAATGIETLCHPSSRRGRRLAGQVQRAMVACLGLADRGVKPTTENDRGVELRILTRTDAPAVIVESHFGSNDNDVAVATDALASGMLGRAIAQGVVKWRSP